MNETTDNKLISARTAKASIADVISCHTKRDFGSSGFREVELTVFNRNETAFTYRIFHFWVAEQEKCSSLFFLLQPSALGGTAVILVERPRVNEMEIWLRLRTAAKPIRLDSSRCDQLILGTDFTYSDLRFWFPTDAFDFDNIEFRRILGDEKCILSASRKLNGIDPTLMRLTLDSKSWLPLTIEWFEPGREVPKRLYCASDLINSDGIWTPRVISVSRPRESYRSVMKLRRVLHRAPVESVALRTENLAGFGKSTFERWITSAHQVPET